MNKELIEKLREYAAGEGSVQGYMAELMHEAADALEAKAGAAHQRAPQPSAVVMPPIPYKPELADADLTDYEKGELQGRCDMWAEFARLNGKEVGRG